MENIQENLVKITERIRKAELANGRTENSVKLMAVSKFHSAEEIISTVGAGQLLFGENRVQEAGEKFPDIIKEYSQVQLHMIGVLQTNKVKNAVKIASCIQSVDSLNLLQEIEKQCTKIEKNINILFELHTGEESKSGFLTEEDLIEAIEFCRNGNCPHIVPSGFMTMAPFTNNEVLIHKSFIKARETKEKMQKLYPEFRFNELSMGMSGDFEIAIEEGSSLVRVGTAIFGERIYS